MLILMFMVLVMMAVGGIIVIERCRCVVKSCGRHGNCAHVDCAHYDGTPDSFFYQELRRSPAPAASERSGVVNVGGRL